ncbi:hypothetical protein AB0D42_21965 [Streptomyces sp. NPDC048304]|uniref:hypothetical protein n=1 Tax=Streptomyces sp. NPDC048304 TaxID=3154820 RepID=UPI0033E7C388
MAERIDLAHFRPAEWERAAAMTGTDPRISQALCHRPEFSLPQVVAGTPKLLHRWDTSAQPYGEALLPAAVTTSMPCLRR